MTGQPDLFESARYPTTPGHRNVDTSIAAAEAVKPKVAYLQKLCLAALAEHGPLTADEIAKKVKVDKGSIRPRCTELKDKKKLYDTGARRKNKSRRLAIVWGLA